MWGGDVINRGGFQLTEEASAEGTYPIDCK